VLETLDDLLAVVDRLYPSDAPQVFALLQAVRRVRAGESSSVVARAAHTTRARIESLAAAADPIAAAFGCDLATAGQAEAMRRPREMLGQLLLGEVAERVFEDIYKRTMGTDELVLEDDRSSRNETDYRVLNGHRRPVFRVNIKFHGTLFRNARDLVGLDPEDCFALATYKIYQGLQKHENERFPYIFVIVGVAGMTGASVGEAIPEDLTHLVSLVHGAAAGKVSGKRSIEESVVAHVLASDEPGPIKTARDRFHAQIEAAEWRVLSARRADHLLREKLFDRVYAVRVRAFARNYRNAELDMHFSLKDDLTPLPTFLEALKTRGLHGVSVDLERGLI
jgi:hypothetical protein